jgi:hypothetical protein
MLLRIASHCFGRDRFKAVVGGPEQVVPVGIVSRHPVYGPVTKLVRVFLPVTYLSLLPSGESVCNLAGVRCCGYLADMAKPTKDQMREYPIKGLGEVVTRLLEFMGEYESINGPVSDVTWGAAFAECIRLSTATEIGMADALAKKAGK